MPSASSPVGYVLGGKYRIDRLLGEGGMGAVYEGENLRVARRVAIKLITPELATNKEIAARFRREALVTSRIASEHIVSILDVEEDTSFGLYLVMELLRGEDLGQRLKRDRNQPLETALVIANHTAMALGAAHAAKAIHRDLKPANIFLHELADGTMTVKVVDFGISKTILEEGDGKAETALTRIGTIVGTLQYMSPEQAQGEPVDGRTDIWSLGCVLYEMLAGKPAYPQAKTLEEAYRTLMKGRPPLLAQVAPWVPAPLVELVEDCMQRKVDRRVPDAATFSRRLTKIMPGLDLVSNLKPPEAPESLPPIEGDQTIVASNEELAEIRRSSRKGRDVSGMSAKSAQTTVAKKGPRPAKPTNSEPTFVNDPRPFDLPSAQRVLAATPVSPDEAQASDDASDEDQSMVARPSDIRELRRMLIQHERHELGLPSPEPEPKPSHSVVIALLVSIGVTLMVLMVLFWRGRAQGIAKEFREAAAAASASASASALANGAPSASQPQRRP
jgi:serine/threonine protein kinase